MTVSVKDGALELSYKGFVSPLAHWHYETFRVLASALEDEKLTFQTDASGKVTAVMAAFEPSAKDIVFERKPAIAKAPES